MSYVMNSNNWTPKRGSMLVDTDVTERLFVLVNFKEKLIIESLKKTTNFKLQIQIHVCK